MASDRQYSKDYLSYLKSFGLNPKQVPESEATKNWWGALENRELEKKLNSKITSFKIEQQLNISPLNSLLIQDASEMPELNSDHSWVIKQAQSMSGKGIKKDSIEGLQFPLLVTPFHKRTRDIGTWVKQDSHRSYENMVDHKFQYKGTITKKIELDGLDEVVKAYRQIGATSDFVIDSYQYEEHGGQKRRLLCEVNYRKSMGRVACVIHDSLFSERESITLFLRPVKEGRPDSQKTIWLSPSDQKYFHLGVEI